MSRCKSCGAEIVRTAFVGGQDVKLRPMDVNVGWGKEPLARFMRAVVRFRCQITDSMVLADWQAMRPSDTVFLRVWIPETLLEQFRSEARPWDMHDPPKVHVS